MRSIITLSQGEPDFNTPEHICQAAIKAINDGHTKYTVVVGLINAIPELSYDTPKGAFYVFAKCQGLLGKITPLGNTLDTDMDFAIYLMEYAGVAVVPGSGFSSDGFIRISYASSEEELRRACASIHEAVEKLT